MSPPIRFGSTVRITANGTLGHDALLLSQRKLSESWKDLAAGEVGVVIWVSHPHAYVLWRNGAFWVRYSDLYVEDQKTE